MEAKRAQLDRAKTVKKDLVRVVVALVPELEGTNTRATIIRRPGEGRTAIVLLSESEATANDLAVALQAVRSSFQARPESPSKERKFHIRGEAKPYQLSPTPESIKSLAHLRLQKQTQLPGHGNVKSVVSFVLPTATGQ